MSHLHIPDGILPLPLWLAGLLGMVLVLWGSVRLGRRNDPQRVAFQAALGGLMLAVMAIPVPIFGFDYCMTLAGPVGVLLGGWGGLQVSFVVTAILALMGQGGFTVIGLNTLVMGLGAALARPAYLAVVARTGPAAGMAFATVVSQVVSSAVWIVLLLVSVRMHLQVEHHLEVDHMMSLFQRGALATVLLPLIAIAVLVESLLGAGIGRFLGRVRPDLLPGVPPSPVPAEARP